MTSANTYFNANELSGLYSTQTASLSLLVFLLWLALVSSHLCFSFLRALRVYCMEDKRSKATDDIYAMFP